MSTTPGSAPESTPRFDPADRYTIRQLIETPNNRMLGPYDQQRRFLCRLWVQRGPCPSCGEHQSVFEAHKIDIETAHFEAIQGKTDEPVECRGCKRKLVVVVPMFGPVAWLWQIAEAA